MERNTTEMCRYVSQEDDVANEKSTQRPSLIC